MSKGTTHAITGIIASLLGSFGMLLLLQWLSVKAIDAISIVRQYWLFLLLIIPVSWFYSMFMDIDHKMGTITWFNLLVSIIILLCGFAFKNWFVVALGLMILTATVICAKFIPHRGPTHTLQFALLSPLLLLLIPSMPFHFQLMGVAAFASWTHLALDKIPFKTTMKGEVKK